MYDFCMRNLTLLLLIATLGQIIGLASAYALSQCGDPSYRHNCVDSIKANNGDKYVGMFKKGKRHGHGEFTSPTGNRYVGKFENTQRHGRGTYTYPDGVRYVGENRHNKRHGEGIITFAN